MPFLKESEESLWFAIFWVGASGAVHAIACAAIRTRAFCFIGGCVRIGVVIPGGEKLFLALRQGEVAEAKRLIKQGVPVDAADHAGSSAVMHAATCSDLATMLLLD